MRHVLVLFPPLKTKRLYVAAFLFQTDRLMSHHSLRRFSNDSKNKYGFLCVDALNDCFFEWLIIRQCKQHVQFKLL